MNNQPKFKFKVYTRVGAQLHLNKIVCSPRKLNRFLSQRTTLENTVVKAHHLKTKIIINLNKPKLIETFVKGLLSNGQ
jgi:hypothetical protein